MESLLHDIFSELVWQSKEHKGQKLGKSESDKNVKNVPLYKKCWMCVPNHSLDISLHLESWGVWLVWLAAEWTHQNRNQTAFRLRFLEQEWIKNQSCQFLSAWHTNTGQELLASMKQSVVFFVTFSDLFSFSYFEALFKQYPDTFAAAFPCKMAERRLPCPEAHPRYHMTQWYKVYVVLWLVTWGVFWILEFF